MVKCSRNTNFNNGVLVSNGNSVSTSADAGQMAPVLGSSKNV